MLHVENPPIPVRIFVRAISRVSVFDLIQNVVQRIQFFVDDHFKSIICYFSNIKDVIIQLLFQNEIISRITMRINCLKTRIF